MAEKIPLRTGRAKEFGADDAAGLAIKNFIAAIKSEDSLFCIVQPFEGLSLDESTGSSVYSGDVVFAFRDTEYKSQKSVHFLLLEKLDALLKAAGSQESLEATLCLTSGSADELNQKELALWIGLCAKGDSPEQALLRWGLGFAQIQQALLFSSRFLRLHLTRASG
ncbi:MAG TPA: hypothetical protein VNH65_01340 [Candidatus Acidoferrum sp.]|nr:hypothetical protein [Candidatus Acidoferrum sp.]